ncbi:MAG TPA: HAD family hydrolase [Hypericibacter adhaerens]|uniref:HAD family hydrolase n=1 Tax=Hypericibacter adhaerens TaxID=2602016 RepID=UPI002B7901BF|nr:HAD family hydrolase [Hypericibacter adhaerens]HWA44405.1 HAD family hydrolase [Hypericibacter adhaerens]
MGRPLRAITFDLWDTIVHDDSDEPKRKAQGLKTKKEERRHLLWEALNRQQPIELDRVKLAYDVADAAFNKVWHDQHVTWPIAERLNVALKGLGRTLPEAELARIVKAHEEMEITIRPDLIPGIREALEGLHGRYKTCIVSDAIVSPGRCLRQLLASYDLARFFDGFAFSDEVGYSKPHRAMFESAARQMGVAIEEIVHIGDRDHNDVKGPQALGMKAILFTATRAADKDRTTADAVCERHADLVATVDRLAKGA